MYHEVGDGVRWAMDHLPFYGRWYRFLVLWPLSDKGLDAARVDPAYADQDYAVSEINAIARLMFTDWITGQADGDEELLPKVLPDYPATGKRTLQDDGTWLRTLRRDNVDLVCTPIRQITADGVLTDDGATHDVESSCTPPASVIPTCCGRWRSPAATVSTCTTSGAASPMPTWASPFRGSPTSSSSTGQARIWPTAAA